MGIYSNAGFCGLNETVSSYKEADAVIVPVPYEVSTSYMAGTKFGPDGIVAASEFLELYDLELDYDVSEEKKIYTSALPHISKDSMESAMTDIHEFVMPFVSGGKFTVVLGGEHSITPPIVKAFVSKYPDLSVLHFDAHGDLRDTYEGTKFSHACAMRRTRELCPVIQLGIRSICAEERDYIKKSGISDTIYYAKDFADWNIEEIFSKLSQNVYLSFDFDAFDPSIMPSVGTPEPGGLLWYDTLAILRRCFETKNVVGCDFVELMPSPSLFHADFLASSLVYKVLSYKYHRF